MDPLLWQLADSAFPAGGFAHSGGLEAAWHLGVVTRAGFDAYVDQSLWQAAHLALPFVRTASKEPARLAVLDALADATLTNHVSNRASRAQGRAFWSTVVRVFETRAIRELDARTRTTSMHYAPIFGVALGALGLDAEE